MVAPRTHPREILDPAWHQWLRWFALCLVIGGTWAMAAPTLGGPDEQAHITKAAAVARGQFEGTTVRVALGDLTTVRTPEIYSSVPARTAKRCYAGHGAIPAGCASRVEGRATVVEAYTYVGTYPPAYYAFVGLPTLLTTHPIGLTGMRLVGVGIGAALLASAFSSAVAGGSRSRLLLGVVFAASPMVWYLIGVVNPNGVEVAGAVCTIASIAALGGAPPTQHGRLVRRAAIGFVACSLARTPSLGFALLAVALGVLALGEDRPRWADLPGRRAAGATLAATTLLAVGWALAHTGGTGRALTHEPVTTSIAESGRFIRQAIGDFGELDTALPWPLWATWATVVTALAVVGLAKGTRSQRTALGLGILAAVAIPIAFQALAVAPVGARWQGRYGLPALVLVPVLAGAAIPREERRPSQRFASLVESSVGIALAAAVVVQWGALITLLRRYQVGIDGPLWFLTTGSWRSPTELAVLALVGLAAWCSLGVEVARR